MVQGRALKASQLMDARQATCSMNLSYLQALLANLFFSFRDFVLSGKKLLFGMIWVQQWFRIDQSWP